MWKRLNNTRATRQPQGADPISFEASYDEKGYGAAGLGIDVHRAQAQSQDRKRPPQRPPRGDDFDRNLPRLPFESVDIPPPPPPEESKFRPVSSICSQSSPNPMAPHFTRPAYTHSDEYKYGDGVSPPSSPEQSGNWQSHQDDDEVSPIDEIPNQSRPAFSRQSGGESQQSQEHPAQSTSSKPPSSSIPVLRREKRRNQVATAAANLLARKEIDSKGRKTADVKWDPYSGEITTSDKGKPQSVKPAEYSPPAERRPFGNQSTVTAAPKPQQSFGDRVRKFKSQQNAPPERPEWKGATGRSALVPTVADQTHIPPLHIPLKSTRRASMATPISGPNTSVSGFRNNENETSFASPLHSEIDLGIQPVHLNSDSERNSPYLNEALYSNPYKSQLRNDPSLPQTPPRPIQKKESTDTIERKFREALKASFPSHDPNEPYEQPPSRFSITTYATSEAPSTHRASIDTTDRPPMPTPPQTFTPNQQPTPILNRKRPKVGIGETAKATTRKAVPSSPVFINMSHTLPISPSSKAKRASTSSNASKSLPASPAEAEAKASADLVVSLQAQLENLAHRRRNIMKSIRQMTELMPVDNVILNEEVRRKREEEKRKVEFLREEEADVKRLEHELGLRLHRAWKRRDKDAIYEPTGLWVRRVTG
ncbi:hypothetical protein B7494_g4641 [Chlorociboria aeruginascens]|nr:hypothetical protein B7494_g4641 [Chlorociboria aeruginascens]